MSVDTRQLPYPDRAWDRDNRRRRVLVESSDPSIAWAAETILGRAGYEVAVCWGPATLPGSACPMVECGRCALAQGADAIVQSFGLFEHDRFPILHALRTHAPKIPICVEVPGPARDTFGDDLKGCTVIDQPMTPQRLLDAIEKAVGTSKEEATDEHR